VGTVECILLRFDGGKHRVLRVDVIVATFRLRDHLGVEIPEAAQHLGTFKCVVALLRLDARLRLQ
jgi:hypothetical protein